MPVGDPVAEVARAERLASPGTVALAESAWSRLDPRRKGHPLGQDVFTLTNGETGLTPSRTFLRGRADVPETLLVPFIPSPVRHRRGAAGAEWMQEVRHVTAMMASVEAPAGVEGLQLQHLGVRAFQAAIARFEGISQVRVDNKGVTLCGVFGAPAACAPRRRAAGGHRCGDDPPGARRHGSPGARRRRERARVLRRVRQRSAPRVHGARPRGQPRRPPDGHQRRRPAVCGADDALRLRHVHVRGARAGAAEGPQRPGGGLPRLTRPAGPAVRRRDGRARGGARAARAVHRPCARDWRARDGARAR